MFIIMVEVEETERGFVGHKSGEIEAEVLLCTCNLTFYFYFSSQRIFCCFTLTTSKCIIISVEYKMREFSFGGAQPQEGRSERH